jgi:ATPase subunit of ABC transporter with duplicated ATPase domains
VPLVKIDNYCLQTPNYRILKDKISLELSEGEVLVISGKNGSGKTTLLRKIEQELKVSFFTLPQMSEGEINFPFTISDIVSGVKHSFTLDQLKTPFNQASGGERRKALFYYLLGQKKEVLLLDEPFNHLDQKTVEELVLLLKSALQEKQIKGLVLISHSHHQLISDHLSFKECLL